MRVVWLTASSYRLFGIVDTGGKPLLRYNVGALDKGVYKVVGEMLATMVVQGGPLPQIFDDSAVNYLLHGTTQAHCDSENLPEPERSVLTEVIFTFCS